LASAELAEATSAFTVLRRSRNRRPDRSLATSRRHAHRRWR